VRLSLLIGLLLAAGLVVGGLYAARAPERTPVPAIELRVQVGTTTEAGKERPGKQRRVRQPSGGKNTGGATGGGSGGGGGGDDDSPGASRGSGGSGAKPVPAPAPAPAGNDDDDDDDGDDDSAERDD